MWDSRWNWNRHEVPNPNSSVVIDTQPGNVIIMSNDVTVQSLSISGPGVLYLAQSIGLTVSGLFNFSGGIIEGALNSSTQYSVGVLETALVPSLTVLGSANFISHARKTFRFVQVKLFGAVMWDGGQVINAAASVTIMPASQLTIATGNLNQLLLWNTDSSWQHYDKYPAQVMNEQVNIDFTLPVSGAVFDKILVNGLVVSPSVDSNHRWPLKASLDPSTANYYALHVPHDRLSVYNRSVSWVDSDQCARLCMTVYSWCHSFDYFPATQSCLLSMYKMSGVGGLSPIADGTDGVCPTPGCVSHFDVSKTPKGVDSSLTVLGTVAVIGSGSVSIGIPSAWSGGGLHVLGNATVAFTESVLLAKSTAIQLCAGMLLINSTGSGLNVMSGADINSLSAGCLTSLSEYPPPLLSLMQGNHTLAGSLTGNFSLLASQGAAVQFAPSFQRDGLFSLLAVSSNATVSLACAPTCSWAADQLLLSTGGTFSANELHLQATVVEVSASARLSTLAGGFARALGDAPGRNHTTAASGGSHGGLGGSAMADTSGAPYGNITWPSLPGSGGGEGYKRYSFAPGVDGYGGGVLHISAARVIVNGVIDCDGSQGFGGGGGGAGGSLLITSSLLTGSGQIRAVGGAGGFSGGLVSGGGGSGGRIALYAEALLFNGTFSVAGGLRVTTYNVHAEQAGPGTVYVFASHNRTNLKVEAIITCSRAFSGYNYNIFDPKPDFPVIYMDENNFQSGQAPRPAYIRQNADSFKSSLGVDLHVLGDTVLVLQSSTFHVRRLLGNIPSLVRAVDGVALTLGSLISGSSDSTFTIDTVKFHFVDARLSPGLDLTVVNFGVAFLYSQAAVVAYRMNSLTVGQYGQVVALNNSISLADTKLNLESGSTLSVYDSLVVMNSTVLLTDFVTLNSLTSSSVSNIHIESTSIAYLSGSVLVQNSVVTIDSALVVANSSQVGGFTEGVPYPLVFGPLFYNLTVSPNSVLVFDLPVFIRGNMTVGGDLTFSGGGECALPCIFDIGKEGNVIFQSNELYPPNFVVNQMAQFQGSGTVFVRSGGFLMNAENVVPSISFIVSEGGVLSCGRSNLESSTYQSRNIQLEVGGTLKVCTGARMVLSHVLLIGGSLAIDTNASVTLLGHSTNFSSGCVMGNGSLIVPDGSSLLLSTDDISRIEQVNIVNHGSINASGSGTVLWGRAARLDNFALVSFPSFQAWAREDSLSMFQQWSESDVVMNPYPENSYVGINSSLECAAKCIDFNVVVADEYRFTNIYATNAKRCRSFMFSALFNMCQLNSAPVPPHISRMDSTLDLEDLSWSLFVLVPEWVPPAALINHLGGSIVTSSTASASSIWASINSSSPSSSLTSPSIGLAFENEGNILIPPNTSLVIESCFTLAAAGVVELGGWLQLTASAETNTIIGNISGAGELILSGPNFTVFHTSLHNTQLSVQLHHSADVILGTGANEMHVKNLIMGTASVLTFNSQSMQLFSQSSEVGGVALDASLNILHVGSVTVSSSSLITFNTQPLRIFASTIALLSGGSITSGVQLTEPNVTGIKCPGCYDLWLHSTQLSVSQGGTISASRIVIDATIIAIGSTGALTTTGRGLTNTSTLKANRDILQNAAGAIGFMGSGGGSHGGRGGSGYPATVVANEGIVEYGDYTQPILWGATGGGDPGSDDSPAGGGGTIYINATELLVDGVISCDGSSPINSLAGGGAGGSLYITTLSLAGSGLISSNGGSGGSIQHRTVGLGGGGGGGRIAVYTPSMTIFSGDVTASGGLGHQSGSAGTVYYHTDTNQGRVMTPNTSTTNSTVQRVLLISNNGVQTQLYTHLVQYMSGGAALDKLVVLATSQVITSLAHELRVGEIIGDGTVRLIATNGVTLASNSSAPAAVTPCLNMTLIDILVLNAVVDFSCLHIESSAVLRLSEFGMSSLTNSTPGLYVFEYVTVSSQGSLVFAYQNIDPLRSSSERIQLQCLKYLNILSGGHVHSDALGFMGASTYLGENVVSGPGSGSNGVNGAGGGGYGGPGGPGLTGSPGSNYGNVSFPLSFGSGANCISFYIRIY